MNLFSFISTVVLKVEPCIRIQYTVRVWSVRFEGESSSWKAKAIHRGYFGSSRDRCEPIWMQVSNEKRKEKRQDVKILTALPPLKGVSSLTFGCLEAPVEIGQAANDCPRNDVSDHQWLDRGKSW